MESPSSPSQLPSHQQVEELHQKHLTDDTFGLFDQPVAPFHFVVDPEPECARRFTFDFNKFLRIQHSQNPFGTHLMQALDKFLFTNIWVYIKPVITYNRLLPWMHFYMLLQPDKTVKISYIPKRCIRNVNPIEKFL